MAAAQLTVADVADVACAVTPPGAAGGTVSVPAVTSTRAVATLSAASYAVTVIVCGPGALGTVQFWLHGAAVSVPTGAPSTTNSTRVTAALSAALTVIGTVPATVAPFAGLVIATVGRVVSIPLHGWRGSPTELGPSL